MRKALPAVWLLAILIAGCASRPDRSPALAEAYAGPASLKLRRDIPLQSAVMAEVQHGERLDIVQRRRRFLKVRTRSGIEGWTEENQLLRSDEMARLRELSEQARKLLSQGLAGSYDVLNVHTLPERTSPSFMQVKEGEKVEVLLRELAPRTAATTRPPLIPPAPRKPKAETKKKDSKYAPPPMPPVPKLPSNWVELSRTPAQTASAEVEEKAPKPMDDWTLIRNSKGQSGWVLSRRLYMAIPDEVAQYAEGHRITSYFALGDVPDGDQVKHNWLWTTSSQSQQPYDFDSFRVFIWSLRRRRYETAYIERNTRGFFPVLTGKIELANSQSRGVATSGTYPGFSVCVEKSDGVRYRRSYAFLVNVVRFAGERACEDQPKKAGTPPSRLLASGAGASPSAPATSGGSFLERLKRQVHVTGRRILGRQPE